MPEKAGVIGVKFVVHQKEALTNIAKFESSIRAASKSVQIEARRINKEFAGIKAPKFGPMTTGAKKGKESLKGLGDQSRATALSMGKLGVAVFAVSRGLRSAFAVADKGAGFSLRLAEIATLSDEASFSAASQEEIVRRLSDAYGENLLTSAPALYDAISAGATSAASSVALMDRGVGLSISTVSSQKQAVSLLSGVLNAYGNEVNGASEVSDDFFAIVKQGKLVLEDLDPALGRVTPLAKSAGLRFKELGASIVALTRSGSSASEAITKIRSILNASIKKADDFDAAMQNIGLRFDSSTFKSRGFIQTLQDLSRAVGGNDTKLGKLLGRVEGLTGLLSLVDDDARLFKEAMEGMEDSAGLVDQAVGELRASVGREFQEIKNHAANMVTGVGESLAALVVGLKDATIATESLREEQARLAREAKGLPPVNSRARSIASNKVLTKPVDRGAFAAGSFEPPADASKKIDELTEAINALIIAQNALGEGGARFEPFVVDSGLAARAAIKLKNIGGELDGLVIPVPLEVTAGNLEKDFFKSIERLIASSDFTKLGLSKALSAESFDPIIGELENGMALAMSNLFQGSGFDGDRLIEFFTKEVSGADAEKLSKAFSDKVASALAAAKEQSKSESFNVNAFFDVEGLVDGLTDVTKAFREINIEMGLGITAQQFNTEFSRDQIEAVTRLRKGNLDVLATAEERLRAGKRSLELQLKGVTGLDEESSRLREILKIRISTFASVIPLARRLNDLEKDRLNNIEKDPGEAERRAKELIRLQRELTVAARATSDAESSSSAKFDADLSNQVEAGKLRILQLNSEINGTVEAQSALIAANRAAEISSINQKTTGNNELLGIYAEQKGLLEDLIKLDTDRARFAELKRLVGLQTKSLSILQQAVDSRGQTSGAAKIAAAAAVADAQLELRLAEQTKPLLTGQITLLREKVDLIKAAQAAKVRNAEYEAGELGFLDSFVESLGRATEDMNSFGELGRSVGQGFTSLTVRWAQSLDQGGNAWEAFEDIVLKGLVDIAIQWGIVGALSTAASALGFNGGLDAGSTKLFGASAALGVSAFSLGNSGDTVLQAAIVTGVSAFSLGSSADRLMQAALLLGVAGVAGGAAGAAGGAADGFALGGVMKGSMLRHTSLPVNAYAGGGVATTPQVAIFGEGRTKAEAFVPLPDGRNIPVTMDMSSFTESVMRMQALFSDLTRSRQAHLGGGGGGGGMVINVDARGAQDPAAIEQAVDRGIQRSMPLIERRIGSSMQSGRSRVLVDGVRKASGGR